MSKPALKNKRLVSRLRSSFNPVVQQALMTQGVPQPMAPQAQNQTQIQPQSKQLDITQDDALNTLDSIMADVEAERVLQEAPVTEPQVQPLAQQKSVPVQQPEQQEVVQPQQQPEPQSYIDPGIISQAIPQAVQQVAHEELNPPQAVSSGPKESLANTTPDTSAVESGQGIQYVEQEPSPEIPPEVESYLQKVENHADQAPEEIVIADGTMVAPKDHNYPSQPVVVVPITPEVEKKGRHKNPKYSIRWLVEWSHKVMKKFVGKVIYKEVPSN